MNIDVGNFVMVRTSTKHSQKLQSNCKGPMRVIEAKKELVFVLDDLKSADTLIAKAQQILPYLISNRASQALVEHK